MKNALNSQKMKYCKKKIVWNIFRNNWSKDILKVLWYNSLWLTLWYNLNYESIGINYEKCD